MDIPSAVRLRLVTSINGTLRFVHLIAVLRPNGDQLNWHVIELNHDLPPMAPGRTPTSSLLAVPEQLFAAALMADHCGSLAIVSPANRKHERPIEYLNEVLCSAYSYLHGTRVGVDSIKVV